MDLEKYVEISSSDIEIASSYMRKLRDYCIEKTMKERQNDILKFILTDKERDTNV